MEKEMTGQWSPWQNIFVQAGECLSQRGVFKQFSTFLICCRWLSSFNIFLIWWLYCGWMVSPQQTGRHCHRQHTGQVFTHSGLLECVSSRQIFWPLMKRKTSHSECARYPIKYHHMYKLLLALVVSKPGWPGTGEEDRETGAGRSFIVTGGAGRILRQITEGSLCQKHYEVLNKRTRAEHALGQRSLGQKYSSCSLIYSWSPQSTIKPSLYPRRLFSSE